MYTYEYTYCCTSSQLSMHACMHTSMYVNLIPLLLSNSKSTGAHMMKPSPALASTDAHHGSCHLIANKLSNYNRVCQYKRLRHTKSFDLLVC